MSGEERLERLSTVDPGGRIRIALDGATEGYSFLDMEGARAVARMAIRKGWATEVVIWRAWAGGTRGRERLGVYRR